MVLNGQGYFHLLQCPECRGELEQVEDKMECLQCQEAFPIINGVPLFSHKDIAQKGLNTSPEKKTLHDLKKKFPFLTKIPKALRIPNLRSITRGKDRLIHYVDKFSDNADAIIVDIGAGAKKFANVISLDIYNYPGIDLCSRADKIPFSDNSVDMIITTSAIEHIVNIGKVFNEMDRILKPGGIVFITAPFICPYHPEPYDLRRWSAAGIQDSLPDYKCIESGSVQGPFATLFVVLTSFCSWALSFGNYPVYLFLTRIFNWLFLPIHILEAIRGIYQKSTPLDFIIYFVGSKGEEFNV